ncbi:N-acetylmuramoyl-L-alanine amidase [Secundilactobacillus muriivasis]
MGHSLRTLILGFAGGLLGLGAVATTANATTVSSKIQTAKVESVQTYKATKYYTKFNLTTGNVYTSRYLKNYSHNLANYPNTTWYSTEKATLLKTNGKKAEYRYIYNANKSVKGWVWWQNLQTKPAPKVKTQYLLVMGHGAGDAGARGNGTTEATYLRNKMLPKLKKYAAEVSNVKITFYNPSHDIVKDTLTYHKGSYDINKKTKVIMFHLDAAGGHGGHVIIHSKTPTARDRRLVSVIKKYIGLNPAYQGYSFRTNLNNCNVLRKRGIDYSLIETAFIDNKSDFTKLNKHLDQIAKGYIEAIADRQIK